MSYINTKTLTTREWELARQIGIGGSDSAKIVLDKDIYKYSDPVEVARSKSEELPESSEPLPCQVGHALEPLIADLFAEQTGRRVHRYNRLIISDKHPWMIANIDRKLYGVKEGLECKSIGEFAARLKLTDPETGESSYQDRFVEGDMETSLSRKMEWYIQMQHYMAVTGWKMWHLAVLIGNRKFLWYDVPRDEDYINVIIEEEKNFWENMVVPERETNGFSVPESIISKIKKGA